MNIMPEKERFYAMPGPNKPPLFIQFILHSKKMTPIDFFYFEDFQWSFFGKIIGHKQRKP